MFTECLLKKEINDYSLHLNVGREGERQRETERETERERQRETEALFRSCILFFLMINSACKNVLIFFY